jgi:hypothetical protein
MDGSLLCSLIREDPTRRAIFGVEVYFQPDPMCFFFYELITTSPVRVSLRSYLNLGKFTDAAGRQIFFCLFAPRVPGCSYCLAAPDDERGNT